MVTSRDLGRYELVLELARGGMAELFLGRLHGTGGFAKLVAIKRILPHLTTDRQFTEMFLQEGRIAARLSHPNVCQVFELGELDGQLFLAMEYLDGVAWDHLVLAGRPSPRLIAGVLAQAAEGLHYAHTLRDPAGTPTPIVHRDVSPQNLFVTVDGVCKVLDFGVSKMTAEQSRTRSGVIKGKLPYMAPEQIRGEPLDGRADVFALGVCAWEAFSGERLFDRPTDFLIWKAITEEELPTLTSRWPQCPPSIAAVVHRALAGSSTDRHPTAQAFADDLRGAAGFASAAEIAEAVRTTCADRLANRSREVAAALAARPEPIASSSAPADDPGTTKDLLAQARQGSMLLRDHSAVVERATALSQPPQLSAADMPGRQIPVAVERRRSKTWLVAFGAAIVAVAITLAIVFATRGSAVAKAPPDAAVDNNDELGLRRLGSGLRDLEKLGKIKQNLEHMRDSLHGDGVDATATPEE